MTNMDQVVNHENLSSLPFNSVNVDYQHVYFDMFDVQFHRSSDPKAISYGVPSTFFRIIFVFISRLGFILIQIGSIPIENIYKIIFYNIFEIGLAVIAYALLGYMLSFGVFSIKGIIGYSKSYLTYDIEDVVVGFCAVLLGTAQISSFTIGRMHLLGFAVTTLLYSAIYQPMLMHWIWNDRGWMNKFHLLSKSVSLKDHGGALVIHLSSSIIGLIGTLFLGRRIIKVEELDGRSIGREHVGSTIVGYIFVIFGYIAFSLPTPLYEARRIPDNYIGIVLINNLIAFATGMLVVTILRIIITRKLNYWIVLSCLQGGVAGIVAVSAGVDIYSPLIVLGISSASSVFFFTFSLIINNTGIEDYCNLTASHLICSFIGSIACPVLAQKENFNHASRKIHILWQCICVAIILAASAIFACVLFLFLMCVRALRSKRDIRNHRRAEILQQYLPKKSLLDRLFAVDDKTELIGPDEDLRKRHAEEKNTRFKESPI